MGTQKVSAEEELHTKQQKFYRHSVNNKETRATP